MKKIDGKVGNLQAVKYNDGTVFVLIGSQWYRPVGQENKFVAN